MGTTGTVHVQSLVLAVRAGGYGQPAWRKPRGLVHPSSIPPAGRSHFRVPPPLPQQLLLEKHHYVFLLSVLETFKTAQNLPEHRCSHSIGQRSIFAN